MFEILCVFIAVFFAMNLHSSEYEDHCGLNACEWKSFKERQKNEEKRILAKHKWEEKKIKDEEDARIRQEIKDLEEYCITYKE